MITVDVSFSQRDFDLFERVFQLAANGRGGADGAEAIAAARQKLRNAALASNQAEAEQAIRAKIKEEAAAQSAGAV